MDISDLRTFATIAELRDIVVAARVTREGILDYQDDKEVLYECEDAANLLLGSWFFDSEGAIEVNEEIEGLVEEYRTGKRTAVTDA